MRAATAMPGYNGNEKVQEEVVVESKSKANSEHKAKPENKAKSEHKAKSEDKTKPEDEILSNEIPPLETMERANKKEEEADGYEYVLVGDPFDFIRRLIFIRSMQHAFDQQAKGRLDDQHQFNLPVAESYHTPTQTRYYAAPENSSYWTRLSVAIKNAMINLRLKMENFGPRQFLLYVIVGLCVAMILCGIYDLFIVKKPRDVQYTDDYYTLKKEGYNPALPTYDECVAIDKKDLACLHFAEEAGKEKEACALPPKV